jgi:RimJ/RimL family protein N-acetyltransferase
MNLRVNDVILRRPEPGDVEQLYAQKNDPDAVGLLRGFALGYSRQGIAKWIEAHCRRKDEVIWVIADAQSDQCLGHTALYGIDHRVGSAELGIMLGAKDRWDRGLGKDICRRVIGYGFGMLHLNRIEVRILENNARARHVFGKLGFCEEGVLRQAQFKEGRFLDVVVMSLLREEYDDGHPAEA